MKHLPLATLAVSLLALSVCSPARADTVTYDFTVTAATGPLAGDTSNGSFSYDSSVINPGNYVIGNDLLASLDFTWDGISYTAATANTGYLIFDGSGQLTSFCFGNNACSVRAGQEQFSVTPDVSSYSVSGKDIGFGTTTFELAPAAATPEPSSLALLGTGVLGVAGVLRRRLASGPRPLRQENSVQLRSLIPTSNSAALGAASLLLLSTSLFAHATQVTLGFQGAPIGPNFTTQVTESGYNYQTVSGSIFVNTLGNPGNDLEGQETAGGGGGVVGFTAVSGDFSFQSLQFQTSSSPETITLTGYLAGSIVGVDTFTLGASTNFTQESADSLSGITLDNLRIALPAQGAGDNYSSIDNLTLNSAAITETPEPTSIALLSTGVLTLIGAGRCRKRE